MNGCTFGNHSLVYHLCGGSISPALFNNKCKMSKTILLLLSHSCNLNCKYCYEKFKDSRKMSWDIACQILEKEFLDETEDIKSIDLLGGEPLTNYPLIPKICDWVWKRKPNLKVFARTNGTLLSDKMKEWFALNKERFILGLSIDGSPEVNYINRGIEKIDLDFFLKHWPTNPVKMTVFPDSVHLLYSSLKYLYGKGFLVIGGLAQGVLWDKHSCEILREQLNNISVFYLENPSIVPISELLDFNFNRAFQNISSKKEEPCWKRANLHSYDSSGNLYPCHMLSPIVQGMNQRTLEDAKEVKYETMPKVCQECPICWCCKKCMGMNYQHTGDFGHNINLDYMCEAQKCTAIASAKLLISKVLNKQIDIDSNDTRLSVENAIKYLKLSGDINNE